MSTARDVTTTTVDANVYCRPISPDEGVTNLPADGDDDGFVEVSHLFDGITGMSSSSGSDEGDESGVALHHNCGDIDDIVPPGLASFKERKYSVERAKAQGGTPSEHPFPQPATHHHPHLPLSVDSQNTTMQRCEEVYGGDGVEELSSSTTLTQDGGAVVDCTSSLQCHVEGAGVDQTTHTTINCPLPPLRGNGLVSEIVMPSVRQHYKVNTIPNAWVGATSGGDRRRRTSATPSNATVSRGARSEQHNPKYQMVRSWLETQYSVPTCEAGIGQSGEERPDPPRRTLTEESYSLKLNTMDDSSSADHF